MVCRVFWSYAPIFFSNFNILINSHLFAYDCQIFVWFSTFHSNFDIFIASDKFQYSVQFLVFQPYYNISWISNIFLKFQYSDQFPPFCIRMSTFCLIFNFSLKFWHFIEFSQLTLKFEHFHRFPTFFSPISIFCSIPYFPTIFHHFDQFPLLHFVNFPFSLKF